MRKRKNQDILIPAAGKPEPAPISLEPDFPIACSTVPVVLTGKTIERLHIHNVFEIGICLEGKGIFVVEDKVFPFEPDDVVVINHLEMHRACMPEGNTSSWHFIMTDPARLLAGSVAREPGIADTRILSGSTFPNRFPHRQHPRILTLVREMVEEIRQKQKHHRENIRSLMALFLVELARFRENRRPQTPTDGYQRSPSIMSRLSPALMRIARDYGESLGVADLARSCYVGTGHLRRLFQAAFHKSPQDYINDYRINMAGSLLSTTDRSVADIALGCGFPTLSSFNRQFRKRKQCAPREWRRRLGTG